MIVDAIAKIYFLGANLFLSLLPNIDSLPSGFNTAMNSVATMISNWTYVVPALDDILIIFSLALTMEIAIYTFKILNFVYNKLRGSG